MEPYISYTLRMAVGRYRLDPLGLHGLDHWARVWDNGMAIAGSNRAVNIKVVKLFALLHDCCRENELEDPKHAERGANFASALISGAGWQGDRLTGWEKSTLLDACRLHMTLQDLFAINATKQPTIAACLDADRLDLPRVGVRTDGRRLLTPNLSDSLVRRANRLAAMRYKPPHYAAWLDSALVARRVGECTP